MGTLQASSFGDRLPTALEQEDASRLKRIMDVTRGAGGGYKFLFKNRETLQPEEVHIDVALGDTLRSLLEIVAKGQSLEIVPIEAELSTKEAAKLLNVSRPYLIKLLDEGLIEHRLVGRHRRVLAANLFQYKKAQDLERTKVLDELLNDDAKDGFL